MKIKRLIVLLLILSIVIYLPCGLAEINWGTKSLNEAETAALAFSMFVGTGETLSMAIDETDAYDVVNGRYVFIGEKSLGADLVILLRINESNVQYWGLELTKDNLIKMELILEEKAPICYVEYVQNDEVIASTLYMESNKSQQSFDDFKTQVDSIINSLSSGDVTAGAAAEDPFLTVFPGINWSMNKDDLISRYDAAQFKDLSVALMSTQTVNDETVTYTFMLTDNKMNQIMIFIPEGQEDYYYNQLRKCYGSPIKASYGSAMIGMPIESTDGDTYVWKTETSYACMHDTTVFYMPLY